MENPEDVKVKGIQIYSYVPPNTTLVKYEQMLNALVLDTRGRKSWHGMLTSGLLNGTMNMACQSVSMCYAAPNFRWMQ